MTTNGNGQHKWRAYAIAAVVTISVIAAFACVFVSFKASRDSDIRLESARLERLRQVNEINTAQCASLRNIYTLLRSTVEESDRRLDNIQYYRQHPAELADAHATNLAILLRFRTPPCPSDVAIPTDR